MFIKYFFVWKILKMAGKMTFNKPGIYLLGGAVAIGAANYANCQEARKFIYGDKELTAAGDGIFAKSYINEIDMFSGDYSLGSRFSSKDKIKYFCTDAKKGLEEIAEGIKPEPGKELTGKEKAFKKYLKGLAKKLKTNNRESLRLLNNAVQDGVISPVRDSLYNEKGWKLNDDVYLVVAKTAKESVPILMHFRAKNYDDIVLEETREAQEKIGEATGDRSKNKGSYCARFGLETGIGTNNEKVVGTFVELPLTSWLSLEGFGSWYAARGNPTFSGKSTEVTKRQRELIGPETYKQRTDEITTSIEEKAVADIGAGLTIKLNDYLEIPLRIGKEFSNQHKTLEGKSTIIHDRNGQLLEAPSVITNTKDCGHNPTSNKYFSIGPRWNLGKNLSVGLSFNKMGRKNSGRINLRCSF